jgi:hypothetical protein
MISHLSDEQVRWYAKSFCDKCHARTAPIQDLRRMIEWYHAQTPTPLPESIRLKKSTNPFLDWVLKSGVYYTLFSGVVIFVTIQIIDFLKRYYGVFIGIMKDISIICIMVGVIIVWFSRATPTTASTTLHQAPFLTPKMYKKTPIPATLKRLVWNANVGEAVGKTKCLCCRVTDITQLSFHCGHVVAESRGGETVLSNLKPICQNCNSSMGSTNMEDFMKKMK